MITASEREEKRNQRRLSERRAELLDDEIYGNYEYPPSDARLNVARRELAVLEGKDFCCPIGGCSFRLPGSFFTNDQLQEHLETQTRKAHDRY
jgi:hypothetical protein